MKNCPMFSLRSNSIELRFRSVLRGNFLANAGSNANIEKNQNQSTSNSKNGFAALIKLVLATLGLGSSFPCPSEPVKRPLLQKAVVQGVLGTNFVGSLVDTRSAPAAMRQNIFSSIALPCNQSCAVRMICYWVTQ